MKKITLILFILINANLFSQTAPEIEWDIVLGSTGFERMKEMIDTDDGNYIVAGETDAKIIEYDVSAPSCGNTDYWIAKFDGEGKKIWDKTIGGNDHEILEKVLEVSDGYLIIGSSISMASCSKTTDSYGRWDYWIVKIDINGNKIWDKSFGGSDTDFATSAIEINGKYIIGGHSRSTKSGNKGAEKIGNQDAWLIAIDVDGNKLWDKTYQKLTYSNVDDLKKDQNGNIWIAGEQFVNGDKDYWILKIDQTGKALFEKTYGGNSDEDLKSLQIDEIGNLFLSGESWSNVSKDKSEPSKGRSDYWVIKLDPVGDKIWDRTLGGGYNENLNDVIYSKENGLNLAGITNSIKSGDISQDRVNSGNDIWLANLSNEGDLKWDKRILSNGYELEAQIASGSKDDIIVASSSQSRSGYDKTSNSIENGYDFWILKLNTAGKIKPDIETLSNIEEECILTQLDAPTAKYRGQTISATTETEFPITKQGETIITWVYNVGEGNILEQEQTVILKDDNKPVASIKNITLQLDASGTASIVPAEIDNGSSDACGIADLSLDVTSFDCSNIGANTVTLTVTDNNQNVSMTTATVTVEDTVDPVAIAQDITVQLDASGAVTIVPADIDHGSNDACGIADLSLDITSFDCSNIGANTVTLTVTDNNNNISTATATVTVED
ncbi:MAG: hypothetical protein R3250_10550, partial [Melioribacteraceae bacterium]|nr:hypothetical protein [Melioribacteraceae bacterium]